MPLESILHFNRNLLSKEYPSRMWHCSKTGDKDLIRDHHFYLYVANGKYWGRVNWLAPMGKDLLCVCWEARHISLSPTGGRRKVCTPSKESISLFEWQHTCTLTLWRFLQLQLPIPGAPQAQGIVPLPSHHCCAQPPPLPWPLDWASQVFHKQSFGCIFGKGYTSKYCKS